ncbi:MAG: FAD-dependent oxidoreductase [Actinomycetota bacterium]|nr:FAD-dependent oxidoreductase [Actinomycetota bacterium]
MAEVVVVGAGVAGLATALALSRHGHAVTLLERDATPLPADPHAAFSWDRRGAPQVRHSHALLARLRNILRDRYPDVLEALLDAGLTEIRFVDMMPQTIVDRTARPGDDDLVALAGRRTTFEWVLRRAVLAERGVRLLDGVAVGGLTFGAGTGRPSVAGVQLAGPHTTGPLAADLVVVANGRQSRLPSWLAAADIDLPEEVEDTGIVYFSRFYRFRDTGRVPAQEGPVAGDLGFLKYGVFLGDNQTFSVTLAAAADDAELRAGLLEPAAFDAAAAAVGAVAPWVDEGLAEPTTPVYAMARLVNRRREFLIDGAPRAGGLHAVGDAHTCTNPLYGRGCSLAMVQATLLADALVAHPDDPTARSIAYEEASSHEVDPWYRAAVAQDRASRQAAARLADRARGAVATHDVSGAADEHPMADLLRYGLAPAIRLDPEVYRAFIRMFNLLTPPETLMTDPDLLARVLAVYQARHLREPEPDVGPDRRTVLTAMGAA